MTQIKDLPRIPQYLAIVRRLENGKNLNLEENLRSSFIFGNTPEEHRFWKKIENNKEHEIKETIQEQYPHIKSIHEIEDTTRFNDEEKPVKSFPLLIQVLAYVRQIEQGNHPNSAVSLAQSHETGNFFFDSTKEGHRNWYDCANELFNYSKIYNCYPQLSQHEIYQFNNHQKSKTMSQIPTEGVIVTGTKQLVQYVKNTLEHPPYDLTFTDNNFDYQYQDRRRPYLKVTNYYMELFSYSELTEPADRTFYRLPEEMDQFFELFEEQKSDEQIEDYQNYDDISVTGSKTMIKALKDILVSDYGCRFTDSDFEHEWKQGRDYLNITNLDDHIKLAMRKDRWGKELSLPRDWGKVIQIVEHHQKKPDPLQEFKINDQTPVIKDGETIEWGCFTVKLRDLQFLKSLSNHCDIELEFDDRTITDEDIEKLIQIMKQHQ